MYHRSGKTSSYDQIAYVVQKIEDGLQDKTRCWQIAFIFRTPTSKTRRMVCFWNLQGTMPKATDSNMRSNEHQEQEEKSKNGVLRVELSLPHFVCCSSKFWSNVLPKGVKAVLNVDDLVLWCKDYIGTSKVRIQEAPGRLAIWAKKRCNCQQEQDHPHNIYNIHKRAVGKTHLPRRTTPWGNTPTYIQTEDTSTYGEAKTDQASHDK